LFLFVAYLWKEMKKILLLIFLSIAAVSFSQNDYLLAENYYKEEAYEKALQVFKKLHSKSPFNTFYLSRLISCYQEMSLFVEVEKLLLPKLKKNPEYGFLYVYLGHNYERQQLNKLAKENYDLAIKSIDNYNSYGAIIGRTFKEYNLLDNAILAYEKAMSKNKSANYEIQIAEIYGEKGNFKKMFESYINLIDKNEQFLPLIQRYASKYITNDAENEANISFKKTLLIKSSSRPKEVWNSLLSWLFTTQGEYEKALIQEKALFLRNPKGLEPFFKLGKIAFDSNNYASAKNCFDFIVLTSSFDEVKMNAYLYIAKIAIATNDPETKALFQGLFNSFGKKALTVKLQIVYADFLTFTENNPVEAREVLEKAITFSRSKFERAKIKLKLGDILVFTGKYNKALRYFSQIQTQLKNHELAHQARFKVAQTSYFKGDFAWAKTQLKILKNATSQLIANDAVALFLTISDNEPVDSIPSGLAQYSKATLLAFQNKTQQAIDTLQQISIHHKGQPIEDEALFKQAKLLIKLGQFEAAVANFKKVITLNPEGILVDDSYFELAELYRNHIKNDEKASEYYQKIIFDYTSSIYLVAARKKYRKIRGDAF
jgi:tetratricopeptide (TPR) repeat protein